MSNKKTIYVVTAGEYSDYHIIGCFDNEEQANICARLNCGEIEKYVLNDIEYEDKRNLYQVIDTQEVILVYRKSLEWGSSFLNKPSRSAFNNRVYVDVRASSEDEAKKVGVDLISKFKAREAGI